MLTARRREGASGILVAGEKLASAWAQVSLTFAFGWCRELCQGRGNLLQSFLDS